MECNICGEETGILGRGKVLGWHDAVYRRCVSCGFVQVVNPTWLEEAYSSAIADVDLGTISRMLDCSRLTKIILHVFLDPAGRFLDYGGGYGAFVRHMRDLGYDYFWFDKHCENLFARDFGADLSSRYELVTAFEVLEHLQDPINEIRVLAQSSNNLLVSTLLIAETPPALAEWHYYAPETGQHIAFYTAESMRRVARKLGMSFSTNGLDIHLFSKSPVPAALFKMVTNRKVATLISPFLRRPTLLHSDFIRGREAALGVRAKG